MKLIAILFLLLLTTCQAVSFPVAPLGSCYDGCEKLVRMDAYPGALIAYNSQMEDGRGHCWLVRGDVLIDSFWGERANSTWTPEATYRTWDEFERSLRVVYP